MHDAEGFRVERPAPVELTADLHGLQRIGVPGLGCRRHDVDVVQEHEARLVAALQTRPDVAAPRCRLRRFISDASLVEDRREELDPAGFVARRIGRIDLDIGLQALERRLGMQRPRKQGRQARELREGYGFHRTCSFSPQGDSTHAGGKRAAE